MLQKNIVVIANKDGGTLVALTSNQLSLPLPISKWGRYHQYLPQKPNRIAT